MSESEREGFLIGIEGGGTETHCLIVALDGTVLGEGKGGPSNILYVGVNRASESIQKAIGEAVQTLSSKEKALIVCIGAAGSGNPEGKRMMQEVLGDIHISQRNVIVHDGVISLMGATAGGPGIVIIAGTGSVCYGMNSLGRYARSTGWGPILGDEGSAYDIARKGMVLALRSHDTREEPTALVQKFVSHLGLSSIEDLVTKVYVESMERHEIAALAPLVLDAAKEGDKAASQLILCAGQELGIAVVAVARQLGVLDREIEVATMGGIFENFGSFIIGPFQEEVLESMPKAKFIRPRLRPVEGAVILAAKELGLTVDEAFLTKLRLGIERTHK